MDTKRHFWMGSSPSNTACGQSGNVTDKVEDVTCLNCLRTEVPSYLAAIKRIYIRGWMEGRLALYTNIHVSLERESLALDALLQDSRTVDIGAWTKNA